MSTHKHDPGVGRVASNSDGRERLPVGATGYYCYYYYYYYYCYYRDTARKGD